MSIVCWQCIYVVSLQIPTQNKENLSMLQGRWAHRARAQGQIKGSCLQGYVCYLFHHTYLSQDQRK
jgi:hypothetical protein